MSMIFLENVYRSYQMGDAKINALRGINVSVEANDYIAILGSSGSGKSTLLNILGALDRPTEGKYWLDGNDVGSLPEHEVCTFRNQKIGFVFQNFNLLPRLTALENVMQPLIYRGISYGNRKRRAMSVLDKVGLSDRVTHLPNQLSGGQRQRVAIARALVTSPSIILADEPTGNLDSNTTVEIMKLFDELSENGNTVIIVTHDEDIADHCNRKIRLCDGNIVN